MSKWAVNALINTMLILMIAASAYGVATLRDGEKIYCGVLMLGSAALLAKRLLRYL